VTNEADVTLWEGSRPAADERPFAFDPGPSSSSSEPEGRERVEAAGWPDAAPGSPASVPERARREEPSEVAFQDVVRGFEIDPGRFIEVTSEELEELAPEPSRVIEIEDFVRLDQIDPVYFEKSYVVVPARGGEKTYRLLVKAMEQAEFVAIGRFVLRTREHVAAVRPSGGFLMLETLFRADEVRDPSTLGRGIDAGEEPAKREVDVAVRLIEALSVDWDPARYPDDYRERVLEMIRGKAGPAPAQPLAAEPGGESEPAVFDLMEALKRSVDEARAARNASQPSTNPRRRRSS
jgi:DNA end-binding protein Ku